MNDWIYSEYKYIVKKYWKNIYYLPKIVKVYCQI